jgi:hypothetical protein
MRKMLFSLCLALALFGADDPWAKVKELKSGTELRVYKKGSAQPLNVKLGDLTDENLIVINKNEESAIARDAIDRIDARPNVKPRLTTESKTSTTNTTGDPKAIIPSPTPHSGAATTETSGNVAVGSRGDFEMVYRRPTGGPAKK